MFSDLAMPVGLTGLTTSQPLAKAGAVGAAPAGWAAGAGRVVRPGGRRLGAAVGLDRLDDVPAVVEGGGDRVAAGRLGAEDAPLGGLDDAGRAHVAAPPVHLGPP